MTERVYSYIRDLGHLLEPFPIPAILAVNNPNSTLVKDIRCK
jgi:hypothetical protein